jgi:hypothetical protein
MSLSRKLIWGAVMGGSWYLVIGPALSDSILRSTLEGPRSFSASAFRSQLTQINDSGQPELPEEYEKIFSRLAALQLAENERVTALWNIVDDETRAVATAQIDAVPPLTYAVDPRFFEPLAPSIIQRIIESYGFALKPLPETTVELRGKEGDQRSQLMTILSLIHHGLLTPDQAAMVLQGALDLLDMQTERKTIEDALREIDEGETP